jgi:hypothetical protein
MKTKANLDLAKLEERMTGLERVFKSSNDLLVATQREIGALNRLLIAAVKQQDAVITVLLRAMTRHLGSLPKDESMLTLVKALLEDEYGTKICDRKRTARRPVPPG